MTQSLRRPLTLASASLLLLGSALAHEDDPKIADRSPAIQGSGFLEGAELLGGLARAAGTGSNAAALGFPAQGMEVHSWLTLGDLGGASDSGNDCWGYVSPSGREYALIGTSAASVVVEVTDPANAAVIARMPGPVSLWRDIKVYQDHFYSVSEGGSGIQVFDLSQVDSGTVTLVNTITGQGADATHNVAIDEDSGFLYRCGGANNGLRIYDLQNPGQPQFVGQWNTRYVHDAQIVTYASGPFAGRQVAFCCGGFNGGQNDTGLTILDVTNKNNIRVMSQVAYPDREYSHQGWLSEDRQRFYLGDELDERGGVQRKTTRVFDVSDLDNAFYTGSFSTDIPCVSHNLYERGGFLFEANYTSGVRVFDVASDPDTPDEIAFFDTAPDRNTTSFNGCWNVYPFFPSGTIIASDLERGLFVLSLDALGVDVAQPDLEAIGEGGEDVAVTFSEFSPGNFDASSVSLEVRALGFERSIPMMPGAAPGEFEARIPGFPCGAPVQWWISGRTVGGMESTFPANAPVEPITSFGGDGVATVFFDNMQNDLGWARDVAGDTAPTGLWVRATPIGTDANPGYDATPLGRRCWFTGQTNISNNRDQDIDAGTTTLFSPVLNMTGMDEPVIEYARWYHTAQNGPQDDVFDIEISNDGGLTWQLLERVGPTGPETEGGWIRKVFRVRDHLEPSAAVQLRFIASDLGSETIVEAAIDDFYLYDVACGTPLGDSFCMANANSTGDAGEIVAVGNGAAATNDLALLARNLPANQFGFFVASQGQVFVPNLAGSQGNLCVGPSIGRFLDQIGSSSAEGTLVLDLDLTEVVTASGTVAAQAGETWNFQAWHRDVNPAATSNLTAGFSITLQ